MSTGTTSRLSATLIDVGAGDSILLECHRSADGTTRYALIDCNDTANLRATYTFVWRFFQRKGIDLKTRFPVFDFVLLTHGDSDHSNGLKFIMVFSKKCFYLWFFPDGI